MTISKVLQYTSNLILTMKILQPEQLDRLPLGADIHFRSLPSGWLLGYLHGGKQIYVTFGNPFLLKKKKKSIAKIKISITIIGFSMKNAFKWGLRYWLCIFFALKLLHEHSCVHHNTWDIAVISVGWLQGEKRDKESLDIMYLTHQFISLGNDWTQNDKWDEELAVILCCGQESVRKVTLKLRLILILK